MCRAACFLRFLREGRKATGHARTKEGGVDHDERKTESNVRIGDGVDGWSRCCVLYAPQRGSRTRRDLRRYAGHKLDEIGEMKDSVRGYTSELLSGVKDNAKACIAKTRETIVDTFSMA